MTLTAQGMIRAGALLEDVKDALADLVVDGDVLASPLELTELVRTQLETRLAQDPELRRLVEDPTARQRGALALLAVTASELVECLA